MTYEQALRGVFPNLEAAATMDQPSFYVSKDQLLEVVTYLKQEQNFALLLDVCAVDYYPRDPRFEVVYHLLRPHDVGRIRLKVRLADQELIPSLVPLYPGANWPERETFDMFGIPFAGHPDLKRIYMPDDWEGYPLRKDYPVMGFPKES